MAMTARQFLDGPVKWHLYEKGLQHLWNELNQFFASIAGTGVTGGATILDSVDIADGSGAGIEKSATRTISGPFASSGAQATVTGETVQPPDPSGVVGPTPARISQQTLTAGFRAFV